MWSSRGQGLNPRSSSLPSALRWLTCLGLVCLGHCHGDQQAQALLSAGHAGAAALSSGVASPGRPADLLPREPACGTSTPGPQGSPALGVTARCSTVQHGGQVEPALVLFRPGPFPTLLSHGQISIWPRFSRSVLGFFPARTSRPGGRFQTFLGRKESDLEDQVLPSGVPGAPATEGRAVRGCVRAG